jgi:rare lipoprotein A
MALAHSTRLLSALVAVGLALPASAAAQGTGGSTAPPPQPKTTVALSAGPHALLGRATRLSGTVKRRYRGRIVRIQRFDEAAGEWRSEAKATVTRRGGFIASWKPKALGALRVRAALQRRRAASVTNASPEVAVRVFAPAQATYYGPGLYGNKTACGQELTPELVGVAHRSLPCGTLVEVAYGGTSIVVPVVDRGPFVKGITWDLTEAAATQLGIAETVTVGTAPLPQAGSAG